MIYWVECGVQMDGITWVTAVNIALVAVSLAAALVAVVSAGSSGQSKAARRQQYFRDKYASSVDLMLDQSLVDKDQLRAIRDSGRSGLPKATRELLRREPVPLSAAAEFIKRL